MGLNFCISYDITQNVFLYAAYSIFGGATMAYSYNKLWKLMIDKNINRTTLRKLAGITSNAMAKMGKNQPVNMEVLAKVCHVLDCGIEDVVEIIDDEKQEA